MDFYTWTSPTGRNMILPVAMYKDILHQSLVNGHAADRAAMRCADNSAARKAAWADQDRAWSIWEAMKTAKRVDMNLDD